MPPKSFYDQMRAEEKRIQKAKQKEEALLKLPPKKKKTGGKIPVSKMKKMGAEETDRIDFFKNLLEILENEDLSREDKTGEIIDLINTFSHSHNWERKRFGDLKYLSFKTLKKFLTLFFKQKQKTYIFLLDYLSRPAIAAKIENAKGKEVEEQDEEDIFKVPDLHQVKRLAQRQGPNQPLPPRVPIKSVRMVRNEDGEIMYVSEEDEARPPPPVLDTQFRWNRRCFDLEYKKPWIQGFSKTLIRFPTDSEVKSKSSGGSSGVLEGLGVSPPSDEVEVGVSPDDELKYSLIYQKEGIPQKYDEGEWYIPSGNFFKLVCRRNQPFSITIFFTIQPPLLNTLSNTRYTISKNA